MFKEILQQQGDRIVRRLREQLSQRRVNASGNLSRSIRANAGANELIVDANSYVFHVEDGRGPSKSGSSPGKLYPRILQWTIDKGISAKNDAERRSMAYAITKKIHESGTRLFRKGGNSGVLSEVINRETVDKIESAVADVFLFESVEGFIKSSSRNGTTNV